MKDDGNLSNCFDIYLDIYLKNEVMYMNSFKSIDVDCNTTKCIFL